MLTPAASDDKFTTGKLSQPPEDADPTTAACRPVLLSGGKHVSFRSSIFYIYCKCHHVILPQCFRYKLAFFPFRLLHLHIPMESTSISASHPPHPPCIQKMGPDAQPTFHVVNTWSSSPYIHATLLSDANDLAYLVDARNLFGYRPML